MKFSKYQATGNDFILIDNRSLSIDLDISKIKQLCDRKFGIGSDGLILIENHAELDFNMVFYNPDGSQSFCGNGSRCAVLFANNLGVIQEKTQFNSTDGLHEATLKHNSEGSLINLSMKPVTTWKQVNNDIEIDTGSPHYIQYIESLEALDIIAEAHKIRYNQDYKQDGINVNFIKTITSNSIKMQTYERGVENETLSCGTGVAAAALTHHLKTNGIAAQEVNIAVGTRGGNLSVTFNFDKKGFSNIRLIGPAKHVFSGEINL